MLPHMHQPTIKSPVAASTSRSTIELRWERLQVQLTRQLRTSSAVDVDDVAAEVVLAALRKFGPEPADWSALLAWAATVARNMLVTRWRRDQRGVRESSADLELLESATSTSLLTRSSILEWVTVWRSTLSQQDSHTLDIILAGVWSDLEIARVRGCHPRTVQASRKRIARAATGNYSRTLFG